MNKRGLGKGLGALITSAGPADNDGPGEVLVTEIVPNQFQPRRVFDQQALNELAQSIRQYGILQPVIVRKAMTGYELVAGERRWRAAVLAGLSVVPAIIREYTDGEMTEIALIENIQRENLNPIEEAMAYQRLMTEFGLTQEEVAQKVGRSRSLVANMVRLLNLSDEVQEYVSRGTLTIGHARPLLALESTELQDEAAKTIIEGGLTARDAEELVRSMLTSPRRPVVKKTEKREMFLADVEERLKMILGTQVRIKPGKLKSKIEIDFYSEDDLERIIEVLSEQTQVAATRSRGQLMV
ncbi:MAG: ParB/RepB/Spo0J family partition protein [Negativicutes bacterium]|nr:ParB/RepB/Spo0J family partition protein [Negativicutes bacterium]